LIVWFVGDHVPFSGAAPASCGGRGRSHRGALALAVAVVSLASAAVARGTTRTDKYDDDVAIRLGGFLVTAAPTLARDASTRAGTVRASLIATARAAMDMSDARE
jgi:hypothetical protein